MRVQDEPIEFLKRFVRLQRLLIAELQATFDCPEHNEFLQHWPKRGTISCDSNDWKFKRHGFGYSFRNSQSGALINFHSRIPDGYEYFEEGRIEDYAESLRISGESFSQGCPNLHEAIKRWFQELVQSGAIQVDPDTKLFMLRATKKHDVG